MSRTVVRIRRFLGLEIGRLRRVPEAAAVAAAALVVVAVIRATASGADWSEILRGQAVNLVSAAVLGGFAYVLFVLRFRRRQLRTYLERYRDRAPQRHHDPNLPALARTIVDELLNARPPHAALVIGPPDAAHLQLLTEVAERLAARRRERLFDRLPRRPRVPVAVDLPWTSGEVSLPALVRDRFVEELVGSSGDAQSGRRLYAGLVRKRQVVALVRGLDRVAQGEPLAHRRHAIARLLEGSLAEGIPFVAWTPADLAPSISEVAAFRTQPLPRSELVAYTVRRLEDLRLARAEDVGEVLTRAFDEGEPTRDPNLLALVADLVARRVRAGESMTAAVVDLFADRCAFRRHLRWMSEWALDAQLDELEKSESPATLALAAIGKEAHYRQEAELASEDAAGALDGDDRRRFAAGVALLSHRRVLDVTQAGGTARVRFTHPAWLAFAGALGLRLDALYWRDLLRPDVSSATLDGLTGALLVFDPDVLRERSFLGVLARVGLPERAHVSLETALAVITALQADGRPLELGEMERAALERGWDTADDVVKTAFVANVDLEANPALIDFLWERVVPPGFHRNSFRVRRAVCSRLGGLGSTGWKRLGEEWRGLVDGARREDLSSWTRRSDHWESHGYAVASLAWTLPTVLRRVGGDDEDAVLELFASLRRLVERGSEELPPHQRPREIGLEISLAEGFKVAAVEATARGEECDDRWCAEAESFLQSSTSWISKQALLQTLALVLTERRGRLRRIVDAWERAEAAHPFVRETAALVGRTLRSEGHRDALTERDIWLEDVEALDDGGVDLSAQAHRLLALTTLLINLTEWRFTAGIKEKGGGHEVVVDNRERAFTGTALPRCFLKRNYAATMFDKPCECSFEFCGPNAKTGVLCEARRFSRSFLQRAQATARAPSAAARGRRGFTRKGFAAVWRALDGELARRERS